MFDRLAQIRGGVAIWLLAYGLLWTVLPLVSNAGLPLDTVEIVAWGREWLVGLYRHPPMKAWLMEVAFRSSGGWLGSAYVLSAVALAVAQLAIYAAIRDVRPRSFAFAAVVLSALIVYFGVHLPQWNANIAQLPFAALFVLGIWRGLDQGGAHWWLLAGLAAAGGFLAKYSFALIPLSVAAFLIYDPWTRSRIRWVPAIGAAALMTLLIAPNLLWLLNSPDMAQEGMTANARLRAGGWTERILSPLSVLGVTLAVSILPAIAVVRGMRGDGASGEDERLRKLQAMFGAALFGPVAAVLVIAVATGVMIKDHWLIVNFLFIPPWLLLRVRGSQREIAWTRSGTAFVLASAAVIALIYPLERQSHYWFADGKPVSWAPLMPAEPLAEAAKATWVAGLQVAGMPEATPVPVIGGNVWAAAAANVLPERPAWYEHLNPSLSPWVSDEDLARHGILVIGAGNTARLRTLGLCPLAVEDYDWANGRGTEGTTVHIEAFLPMASCPQ